MADAKKILNKGVDAVQKGAKAAGDFVIKRKDELVKQLDVNGNGSIDIDDIINTAIKIPGVRIDREKFLRKEFTIHYDQDVVDKAAYNGRF